ncbi:hypothetical protein EG329_011185 [Mollisiaceae sp. DMI_Dod_QoI]|nr:hypothetical protein EG329_011185 [Helotiales sp. DMI_Dod_QoI]
MDPLSALSVAGTIVQLVDFGNKLFQETFQLYKSGTGVLKKHEELKLIIGDLKSVIFKLRQNSDVALGAAARPLSAEDQEQEASFHRICNEALQIAEMLLQRLERLQAEIDAGDGKMKNMRRSINATIRAAWSKDEIKSLLQRLSVFKESLNSRLIFSLRYPRLPYSLSLFSFSFNITREKLDADSVRASDRFDTLDTQTKQILVSMLRAHSDMPQDIINPITKLLCRLQVLNQDEHLATRQMIIELRNAQSDSAKLNEITANIEMLDVGDKEEKELRLSIDRKLLEYLKYPAMTYRYEDVLQAHPKTFDWIFASKAIEKLPWSDFNKWLRSEGGIYWISGKAGSGKSTLMKHIFDDPRTKTYLQQWGQPQMGLQANKERPVVIATFFFWNSGTEIQKSQLGLLRSLLFQVLGKHRDLIPICLPNRWAKQYSGSLDLGEEIAPEPWSLPQLTDAFRKLVCQQDIPLKLCFFIDGLDEFGGNTIQLCHFLREISRSNPANAKFCLSSRPWAEFQTNFEGYATLRLQDMTVGDIRIYVDEKFHQDPGFLKLKVGQPEYATAFINEIVEKAEGVFLWVQVVVRLLLTGVAKRDSMAQLWQRLRSFPRDLYPLYSAMLLQIKPVYLEWASKAFQIKRRSTQLQSDPFQKLDRNSESADGVSELRVGSLYLALANNDDIHTMSSMSDAALAAACEDTYVHLAARCAGLLEVSIFPKEAVLSPGDRVIYMHRTARDFLEQPTQWANILSWVDPLAFSANFAMMKASINLLEMQKWRENSCAFPNLLNRLFDFNIGTSLTGHLLC